MIYPRSEEWAEENSYKIYIEAVQCYPRRAGLDAASQPEKAGVHLRIRVRRRRIRPPVESSKDEITLEKLEVPESSVVKQSYLLPAKDVASVFTSMFAET